MDDSRTFDEALPLPLQAPHWHLQHGPVDEGLPPLRLVLQPQGVVFDVERSEVLIGRHSQADIRLPLPDVSRRHCRLVCTDGGWEIFDLKSLNGVFLNGERVQHARLHQNDLLRVGGLVLVVDLPTANAGEETTGYQPRISQHVRSIVNALPLREDNSPKRQAG